MACLSNGDGGLHKRAAIGAVLLAAGSASRMGHRPKSLLELDGVPLIRRQMLALSGAGVKDIVVVLGHYADRIKEAIRELPATLVHNPDPDAGRQVKLHSILFNAYTQLCHLIIQRPHILLHRGKWQL